MGIPGYFSYCCPSSFHWRSELSEERKQAIIDFCNTLTPEQRDMIEELVSDAREQGYEDGAADESL